MAVRRTVLRLGAVLVGLAALGVALPTLASSHQKPAKHQPGGPKAAARPKGAVLKCCQVRLREVAGTVVAGGQPASVTATVAAGRDGCTNVRPSITISLAGLDPDEVRIERVVRGTLLSLPVRPAPGGAVQATDAPRDAVRLCGDGRANLAYRLTFLAGAPAGRATVSAEAGAGGGKVLGRDTIVTVVQGPAAARPPAGEPPAGQAPAGRPPAAQPPAAGQGAPAGTAPTSEVDGPSAAGGGGTSAAARLSSALVATGLGAVVAVTVALVGVLALRQRRRGGDPDTGSAEPAHRHGPVGRQPTLAARWSSLVGAVRRPSGQVGRGS